MWVNTLGKRKGRHDYRRCRHYVLRSRVRQTSRAYSSSVMVSVRIEGAFTPRPPLTVAQTKTNLSGASTPLSTPVMVTAPVLEV